MRIGLIVPGFSASDEDWGIPALAHLVRALAERRPVDVFALRHPPTRRGYSAFGARVHPLAWGRAGSLRRPLLLAPALLRIVAEGRRSRFAALHAFWADEPGYLAVLAARILGVPAVVSLAGGERVGLPDIGYGTQLGRAGRWLVRRSLRRATRVTVGSRFLAGIARPYVEDGRLLRVPLGVEPRPPGTGAGAEPVRLAGHLRLLHVGSLVPVKDQALLLRAVARVAEDVPDVHLHVVGRGPLRGELERLAGELGLDGRVTFHGEVRHDRLAAYYAAADLCLLTSRFESQGMVVLEAAACGRCTVGTAVGVLPEIAPDGCAVRVGDLARIARMVVGLLRDPATLARQGEACRATVERRFSLDETLTRFTELYGAHGVRG